MSLNWKEIDAVLAELDLRGSQIQGAAQSAFDVIALRVRVPGREPGEKGATRQILIALSPGACRVHETFRAVPKTEKPLRFAQFLNSKIVNGWIEDAAQIGMDRIVRLSVRRGEERYRIYARLWSNAANVIVTDEEGAILDAMRRLPKRGEIKGGLYRPEETPAGNGASAARERVARDFADIETKGDSYSAKIDEFYARHGGALSLDALRERARAECEGSMERLRAALGRLRDKESDFAGAERLREQGDIILANLAAIQAGDEWLVAEDFFSGGEARIRLEPLKAPGAQADLYYAQYGKAKKGLAALRAEISAGERELEDVEKRLALLVGEENPLVLAKILRGEGAARKPARSPQAKAKKRPGLAFKSGDWLMLVGRDADENDALLRRHVRGSDLWLHARDFPGAYVFIKARAGKSFPLEALLDAGNLALFYSKGRSGGEGDLFYTQAKYLRRAKNGPKGLVIPTQEKNLRIKLDDARLRRLETCRVD